MDDFDIHSCVAFGMLGAVYASQRVTYDCTGNTCQFPRAALIPDIYPGTDSIVLMWGIHHTDSRVRLPTHSWYVWTGELNTYQGTLPGPPHDRSPASRRQLLAARAMVLLH